MDLDIITLVTDESSAGALRSRDPFLYFSVFTDTGSLSRDAIMSAASASNDTLSLGVTVPRRRRVSTEVDAATHLLRTYPNATGDDHRLEYDVDDVNEEGVRGIGDAKPQVDDSSAKP